MNKKFVLNPCPETRDEIITSMCYSWDHSFGLDCNPEVEDLKFICGYTDETREHLWNRMAQIYDHHVAPYNSK